MACEQDAGEEGVHGVCAAEEVVPGDGGVRGLRHGVWRGAADEREEGSEIGGRGAFGDGGLEVRDLAVEVEEFGEHGGFLREFGSAFDAALPGHLPVTR